ncbi:unnamed protein product [Ixodes pacificus]
MLVVSLIGNLAVCFKLLTSRRHRYFKAQVLFLNLALADLLVTLVTMSSQLVWEVMGRLWIAGDLFCRLFKVLQTFSLVSSTYMLVSVAIDRHFAIVNPLSPSPKPRSLAMAAWVLSLIPSLPNIFVFRLVTAENNKYYCASLFYIHSHPPISRQVYMAFVFSSVFIIPLFLLIALYSTILLEMWRLGGWDQDSLRRNSTGNTLPRARVRTLRMTIVIFVAFLVTNLPYIIQEMVLAFAKHVSMDRNLVAIFGVISASNSAVNPYVYLAFNAKPSTSSGIWGLFGKLTGSKQQGCAQRTPVILRFKAKPLNQRQQLLIKSPDVSCQNKNVIKLVAPESASSSQPGCLCAT